MAIIKVISMRRSVNVQLIRISVCVCVCACEYHYFSPCTCFCNCVLVHGDFCELQLLHLSNLISDPRAMRRSLYYHT